MREVFLALTSEEPSDAPEFTVQQFRDIAQEKYRFVMERGFHRVRDIEETNPVLGTFVLLGTHVGFIFSLDLRDRDVGARVVKVVDGRVRDNMNGGYSSDIFQHLVVHSGYRGGPAGPSSTGGPTDPPLERRLDRLVDGWAQLLRHAGGSLLQDSNESLPPT